MRPGVLLVDSQKFAVVDLDAGVARPVDVAEVRDLDHPELQPVAGSPMPPEVEIAGFAASAVERPETDSWWAIEEPLAFRLESGRVLAWHRGLGGHVELDDRHLAMLDACRRPRSWAQLERSEDAPTTLGELVDLGAVRPVEPPGDDDGSPATDDTDAVAGARAQPEPSPTRGTVEPAMPDRPDAVPVTLLGRARRLLSRPDRRRTRRAPGHRPRHEPHRRVPVIPLYHSPPIISTIADGMIEPSLAIGVLFAHARVWDDGRLAETYDLRRLQADPQATFAEWAAEPVPAVFVFSDYIWNVEEHLSLSRRIKAISPESVCLHGGPSSPKYEPDTVAFLEQHPEVDVAARGEGEMTFVEVLDALDGRFDAAALDSLADVVGITFRRRGPADGSLVRTADRERPADLDEFPSPYLTGEFDDLLDIPWRGATIETNRGCPYGCTFCDWGSATLSRIRKFDLQRVKDELEWIISKAPTNSIVVADANFGIFARDVEIVEHIVEMKFRHPGLSDLVFAGVAKNTTKYTKDIYRITEEAGLINVSSSLSIQTVDEHVLDVIDRKNIKLERFDELAASFEELSLPMMTDIIFGLPGSTVESFKRDLQHCFDKDVTARVFPLLLLPNSPMNAPDYRREHDIRVDDRGIVVGSSTYDEADFARMERLRLIFRMSDHFGVLRQLMRFVQWDHGVPAAELVDRIDQVVLRRGNRYPLLAFFARMSDLFTMPPVAWEPFYDEVVHLLAEEFGIRADSAMRSVIATQIALLPARGRQFPDRVHLDHDVVRYVEDHRRGGAESSSHRPLERYGPGELVVSDPGGVCHRSIRRNDFKVRREMESGNLFWIGLDWELKSPFARALFTNTYLFTEEGP